MNKNTYIKNVVIATLAGGLGGAFIGQVSQYDPKFSNTLLATVLGAAVVGTGYGFYLRTGGESGQAVMAGFQRRRYVNRSVGRFDTIRVNPDTARIQSKVRKYA